MTNVTRKAAMAVALGVLLPAMARPQEPAPAAAPPAETRPETAVVPPAPAVPAAPAEAAPAEPQPEPRKAFWGLEPGRPYDETDKYTLPVLPIHLSGEFWVDNGYMAQTNTQVGSYDKDVTYSQGRFVLGASYRRDVGGLFAEARVQLVGFDNEYTKSQYEPHTQDAFVRVGGRAWDVQFGRFLAWEPYYRGNGIERYTAEEAGALGGPPMYRVDYVLGHKDEAGQLAVHLYPARWAAFELAGVYGQELNQNNLGVRPTLALRGFGFLLTGAYEYLKQTPQDSSNKVEQTSSGFGGRLQYTLFGATVGVDAAFASVDAIQIDGKVNSEKTVDKTSLGGFVECDFWNNVIGAGMHRTVEKNKQGEEPWHVQSFVSYLYRLPVQGLSVKAVYGFARAHLQDVDADSEWENDMSSFRVRIQYEFR